MVLYLVELLCGVGLPVLATGRAITQSDQKVQKGWLKYWVVLGITQAVESIAWPLGLKWVPLYSFAKVGFIIWLWIPPTQGAIRLYDDHVEPHLAEVEGMIGKFTYRITDFLLRVAQSSSSIGYPVRVLLDYLGIQYDDSKDKDPGTASASEVDPMYQKMARLIFGANPNDNGSGMERLVSPVTSLWTVDPITEAEKRPALRITTDRILKGHYRLVPPYIRDPEQRRAYAESEKLKLNALISALEREEFDSTLDDATNNSSEVSLSSALFGSFDFVRREEVLVDNDSDSNVKQRRGWGFSKRVVSE
ncbi:hypothetical protein CANCADRAFT_56083 [Tortispora caseinolytica NRRL Y-17796]|uniref:Protein YOP1 n=1 Tax=Tortispora caseinolytica NRRL Y-17796 TaxID=767744 RepID=A0A1E4TL19_9ASCO|nr:hypothetical protein CANCADRAFT_56083 [Tortispora caseinolytica NRRL Y-17796]